MKYKSVVSINLLFLHLLILLITPTTQFELIVNDQEIENPKQVLKSKFKKLVPLELQENLEIPVRPNQINLRESFIQSKIKESSPPPPLRPFETKKYTNKLKSLFRKSNLKSGLVNVETTSSITYATETSSESDFFEIDTDDEEDVKLNSDLRLKDDHTNQTTRTTINYNSVSVSIAVLATSTAPTVESPQTSQIPTIHSNKSWIKEFLQFKKSQTQKQPKRSSLNNHRLKSKITEYEDSLNNPKDLKKWVRLIASPPPQQYQQKKNYLKNINQEIEIDINEFISYLVKEQNFNESDLNFLKFKNLDYGLIEIEQELNKLKEDEISKKPKVISIGGEDIMKSNDGSLIRLEFWVLFVFFVSCVDCIWSNVI
ncbi:hypothetical protein KGF54_003269 [Candida jiufengensis]|uniref:uncharacterized protein n=1 Tax=Candida jiufengensis TaxID=497108 RepID=UPI0022256DE9|nr:uncharacterized protein KGF54_003269 [Candida jiufengensis]KAI5952402.1 hypothetical protein KGF54_003269 [Candida jiufengensis]